jgi:hypothetical protein
MRLETRQIIYIIIFFVLLLISYPLDGYQRVIDFWQRTGDLPVLTLLISIGYLPFGYLLYLSIDEISKKTKWLVLGGTIFLIHFLIVYIWPHSISVDPDRCNVIKLMIYYDIGMFIVACGSDQIQDHILK